MTTSTLTSRVARHLAAACVVVVAAVATAGVQAQELKNTVSYSLNGTPKRMAAPGVTSVYCSPWLLIGLVVR